MSCPDIRFDTENMFPGVCSCSQQNIDIEDNTKLRMGNNTGSARMNDRVILDFQNSDNSINSLNDIMGTTASQIRYFPSVASMKEHPVPAKRFDNKGYSTPKEWKNRNQQQPPQQSSGETKKKEGFGNLFTSSTNADNGPFSNWAFGSQKDKKKDGTHDGTREGTREGFCGCHSRPQFNSTVSYCCVAGVVVMIIILFFVIFKGCPKSCCQKQVSENQLQGMIARNSFPLF